MGQYKDAVVNVTNGSATVTGVGTLWLANVSVGDTFKIKDEDAIYTIGAVNSDTSISLTANYAGATKTNFEYQITVDFTPNLELPEIWAGDIDWPYHLTQALRKIDEVYPRRVKLTVDRTNSTTSLANATGLSFTVEANKTYAFEFYIRFRSAATTTGIQLSVNAPASPTALVFNIETPTSNTAITDSIRRAADTGAATSGIDSADVDTLAKITGLLVNGANAGTLIVRFASEVGASTVTIKAGSIGILHPVS
jgi:hypothetical protein